MFLSRWLIACAVLGLPLTMAGGQQTPRAPTPPNSTPFIAPPVPYQPGYQRVQYITPAAPVQQVLPNPPTYAPAYPAAPVDHPQPSEMVVRQLTQQALRMAAGLCRKGMFDQAEFLLHKVQRLNPDDPEVRQALVAIQVLNNLDRGPMPGEAHAYPVVSETPFPRYPVAAPAQPAFVVSQPAPAFTTYCPPPPAVYATGTIAVSQAPACSGCSACPLGLLSSALGACCKDGCCATKATTDKDCCCASKATAAKDCCCATKTTACAEGCCTAKTTAKGCCCTVKCGCGDTCQCKGQHSVPAWLPASGQTVVWVIQTNGLAASRCPVLNKNVQVFHTQVAPVGPVSRPKVAPTVIYQDVPVSRTVPVLPSKPARACPCEGHTGCPGCPGSDVRRDDCDDCPGCTGCPATGCPVTQPARAVKILPSTSGSEESDVPANHTAGKFLRGFGFQTTPANPAPKKQYFLEDTIPFAIPDRRDEGDNR